MIITTSGEFNHYKTVSINSLTELNEITPRNFDCIIWGNVQYTIHHYIDDKGRYMYFVKVWVYDVISEEWRIVLNTESYTANEIDIALKRLVLFVYDIKGVKL